MAVRSRSRESDSSFRPRSRYSFSLRRIRSRGSIASIRSTATNFSAVGGSFKYSTISGSTPFSRSRLTACLDLLHLGLCQITIPIWQLLLAKDHKPCRMLGASISWILTVRCQRQSSAPGIQNPLSRTTIIGWADFGFRISKFSPAHQTENQRLTKKTSQEVLADICIICAQRCGGEVGLGFQNSEPEAVKLHETCGDLCPGFLKRFLGNRTGVRSQRRIDQDIKNA